MMTKIVAVTACITGIAHTFMAEANLKKVAKKEGIGIKVETQGGMGVQGKLSQKDVDEADVVILAADTKVVDLDRFAGKPTLKIGTSPVVKEPEEVIKKALALI